jgi:HD-like signal output (HDOD) protein
LIDLRRRILFVDDEQMILTGLRNGLRKHIGRWDMVFTSTGDAALAELATSRFAVIVSDMRMPQMDGVELLETVRREHPLTARIILTGYAEPAAISSIFAVAHQLLSKPCGLPAIAATIERACHLHDVLADPGASAVAARFPELPPLPSLYYDTALTLAYPELPVEDITTSLQRDAATCSRVLALCTAGFGFDRTFTSAAEAVARLGVGVIGPLVLASHAWATIGPSISLRDEQIHGLEIARLAATSPDRARASDAFAAGLLHDLGKLLLARHYPTEYAAVVTRARETGISDHVIERELLGTTHSALAAHVLARWGVALPVIDAVAHHDTDSEIGSLASVIGGAHLATRDHTTRQLLVTHAHN